MTHFSKGVNPLICGGEREMEQSFKGPSSIKLEASYAVVFCLWNTDYFYGYERICRRAISKLTQRIASPALNFAPYKHRTTVSISR